MLNALHIAAVALLLSALARGQTPEPPALSSNYVLRAWDTADGLPDNNVAGVAQTPDGYMWFATRAGLARFDGVRFTVFRTKEMPGLQTNIIRTVYAARDGSLWIGLDRGGVSRLVGDRCEIIVPLPPKEAVTRLVCSFAEDSEGAIWIGYGPEPRVQRWHRGALTSFTVSDGLAGGVDTFVHADTEQHVWASSRYGFAIFDGNKFRQIDGPEPPFVRLAPARNGGVWVTRGNQLLRYHADGKKETVADLTPLGGAREITTLFESRDGEVLLGTNGMGVCRYRAARFQRLPTSHSYALAIGEDRAGNVWIGTQGGGVNLVRPRRFVLRATKAGIPKESVVSLCTDAGGRLWVISSWAPPAHAVDAQNKEFQALENWYARNVTTVCADREGGVWIGHDGGNVARWFKGEVTRLNIESTDRVETLLSDSTGDLWIASMDGRLVRWHDGKAESQPDDRGLNRVRALAEDAAGRIWAGTEEGKLFRRENGVFIPLTIPGMKPSQTIRFIVPDGSDTLWIGTRDDGLLRWRAGTFTRWSLERGLPHDDLRALIVDEARDLWLATGRGLFRVNRPELDAVLDDRRAAVRPVFFGESEGVPGTSFKTGHNSTARTADQRLWFATARGALEVQSQRDEHDTPPAPVMIEELRANDAPLPLANAAIAPDPRRVELRFTAPYFGTPERVQFRYRLSGVDDNWVTAGTERTATFARLPPGRYTFEVAATDAEGAWQPRTATIAFIVRAAWWETLAFRIAAGVLAAAALAWIVRWIVKRRMRARLRRLEQEHALERERIRIARDMHDQLGASLTQIGIATQLVKLDPPEAVAGHVDEISAVARRTVESLDEIVWAVNPRYDTLTSLVEYLGKFAVSFLNSSGLTAKVDIPHSLAPLPLSSNVRHHLFLAVREALNNVVKHAGATTVWLHVEMKDGVLRVIVTDDGRGFQQGDVQPDSNGLRNMRERMAEIRGECRIDGNPTAGTRVICELPLTTNGA